MLRQVLHKLSPVGAAVVQQFQRNIAVSAVVSQKAPLDPVQQLFVDKIREYKTKSTGGKLVDADASAEAILKDMLGNLERSFQATGVDMTQFPTFNFTEPEMVWPGLTEEQSTNMYESALAAESAALETSAEEEHKFDPFEGFN